MPALVFVFEGIASFFCVSPSAFCILSLRRSTLSRGMEAAEGAAEGAAAPQYKLVAKWNKEKFEFELAGTLTVGDVKRELECRTKVPGKRQKLIGLGKKANPDDRFIEVAMGAHDSRREL